MHAPVKRNNRSPVCTDPIVRLDNSIAEVRERDLTDLDGEIFALFGACQYRTAIEISAFTGRHPKSIYRRLKQLRASSWIKPVDWQLKPRAYRPGDELVMELTYRGDVYCRDHGISVTRNEFTGRGWHQIGSSQLRADFDYGLRGAPGVQIIPFREMMKDPRIPDATKNMKEPYAFEVEKAKIYFDCHPFLIKRPQFSTYHFILGTEWDRQTEPITRRDNATSHIRLKVRRQVALLKSGHIKERFGISYGYIIYAAPSMTRIENMTAEVEKATEEDHQLRKWFLFKVRPDANTKQIPTGDMLTGEYRRVASPPLCLIT
jgi:hypothetical protein